MPIVVRPCLGRFLIRTSRLRRIVRRAVALAVVLAGTGCSLSALDGLSDGTDAPDARADIEGGRGADARQMDVGGGSAEASLGVARDAGPQDSWEAGWDAADAASPEAAGDAEAGGAVEASCASLHASNSNAPSGIYT